MYTAADISTQSQNTTNGGTSMLPIDGVLPVTPMSIYSVVPKIKATVVAILVSRANASNVGIDCLKTFTLRAAFLTCSF